MDILELPEISDYPKMIIFEDNSYSIDWWEHIVYLNQEDKIESR